MFLATTGLTEFWDTRDELLLLGPWCLRPDRRQVWETLRYQMLPNPWDDRRRMYESIDYLENVHARLLGHLRRHLNATHGLSHSERYWQTVLGPWLLHFLHAAYDRYVHLREALDRHPALATIGLDEQCFQVPAHTAEAVTGWADDPYNLQLMTQLLHRLGYRGSSRRLPGGIFPARSVARQPAREWWNDLCLVVADVALCDVYVPRSAVPALWRRGVRVMSLQPASKTVIPPAQMNDRRTGLGGLPARDHFEHLAVNLLPQHLPRLFMEGFGRAREELLRRVRRMPPLMVCGSGWFFNEPVKLLAAEAAERGTRLVSMQHGGSYGIHRYVAQERHERSVADRVMVWGWAGESDSQLDNVSSPHLALRCARASRRPFHARKNVLLVVTSHPRYAYRFHSMPAGAQWEEYFAWQLRFLEALPPSVRQAVRVRPYPEDYGRRVREQIARRIPDVGWDASGPLHRRLQQARVAVIDHPTTSWLEALAANVPTVLFWDPGRWEVRDEAAGDLDRLRASGLLYDTPEAAAEQLEGIYDRPLTWWRSESLQAIRRQFVARYAQSDRGWLDAWGRVLNREVALSRTRRGSGDTVETRTLDAVAS